jgi:hypothetical protein
MPNRPTCLIVLLSLAGCSAAHSRDTLDHDRALDDDRAFDADPLPVASDSDDEVAAPAPMHAVPTNVETAIGPDKWAQLLCGGISLEPFDAAERTDRGPEGLGALRSEAEAALDTFTALRAEHHDNYTFVVMRSSFIGWHAFTTLTVRAGQVVRRAQHVTYDDDIEGLSALQEFVEEGAEIGTHGGTQPAITLPELYAPCLDRALCSDPARYELYLATDEQGVLATCGTFPIGCYDDCYQGFRLQSVTFE